jgi:hypothetical protein
VACFSACGILLGTTILLLIALFTGCGGQAESAPQEQTAEAPPLHEDRWCCTRHNAYNGIPYLECGLPGAELPEDATDCTCDAYLVDCEGE